MLSQHSTQPLFQHFHKSVAVAKEPGARFTTSASKLTEPSLNLKVTASASSSNRISSPIQRHSRNHVKCIICEKVDNQ